MAPNATAIENIKACRLPVFFVPLGSHVNFFFDRVLKQAVASNGWENVYVLTNANFHLYTAYNCIDVSKYMQGRAFDTLYQHHSTNPVRFEKACFDRWFIINDLVKDLSIQHFFHADCDVMIYGSLQEFHAEYIKDRYAGSMMFFDDGVQSITSGHSSFWSNRLINDLCEFINARYTDTEAFNRLLADTRSGRFYNNTNVSDMILLDTFRRESDTGTLNLFTLEDKGFCFDLNVNVSYNGHTQHFEMSKVYNIKKLICKNNQLYGLGKDGRQYRFYTIHFQGYLTKALIPMYITYGSWLERSKNKLISIQHFRIRQLKLLKNKLRDLVKKGN